MQQPRSSKATSALIVFTAAAASGLIATPATGAPIIQEVFYDASGLDSGEAFTEIFGMAGMPLDGWSLVGINGGTGLPYRTLDLTGATIPGDGLLVIATSSAAPSLTAVRDFTANVDWQNGPDAVQLIESLARHSRRHSIRRRRCQQRWFWFPRPRPARRLESLPQPVRYRYGRQRFRFHRCNTVTRDWATADDASTGARAVDASDADLRATLAGGERTLQLSAGEFRFGLLWIRKPR